MKRPKLKHYPFYGGDKKHLAPALYLFRCGKGLINVRDFLRIPDGWGSLTDAERLARAQAAFDEHCKKPISA